MANRYYPDTITEIKVFLLFLFDQVRGPIDSTALYNIIGENVVDVTFAYSEALADLVDRGHLLYDKIDGEEYYMISDTGRAVSRELYDTLPKMLRDDTVDSVSRYVRITNDNVTLNTAVSVRPDGQHEVRLSAKDERGEFINLTICVPSASEAERMCRNFEGNPSGVYRGFLFSLTGRIEYLN